MMARGVEPVYSTDMERLLKAILIRGEQLANIEGAIETAQLLQSTASLLNYFSDGRSWGLLQDELHALRDYGKILRSCFGRRVCVECALPGDQFIRRRVLLSALLETCSLDRVLMDESGKTIDIKITAQANTDEGSILNLQVRFEGDAAGESIVRACRC